MVSLGSFAIFLAAVAASSSFPSNASLGTEAGCTISSFNDVGTVTQACTTITIEGFTVPAGQTLNLVLQSNSTVVITGVINFDFHEWEGPLLKISGSGVTVSGASGVFLDGNGPQYWDSKGDLGRTKPKFVRIETTGNSVIQNLDLKNCPRQCFAVASSDTELSGCDIDISDGLSLGGHNTDGYDVVGSRINITSAVVVNQDDCVVINAGSNIQVTNLTCIGGHGLSLSVKTGTISDVVFKNCTVQKSRNGIHVKTMTDGFGNITDVQYNNIKLSEITHFGVNIQQDYKSGVSTGLPTANIPIKNLNLNDIQGSMTGGSNSKPIFILCAIGGCESWTWNQVSISNGTKVNSCTNFKPFGFDC